MAEGFAPSLSNVTRRYVSIVRGRHRGPQRACATVAVEGGLRDLVPAGEAADPRSFEVGGGPAGSVPRRPSRRVELGPPRPSDRTVGRPGRFPGRLDPGSSRRRRRPVRCSRGSAPQEMPGERRASRPPRRDGPKARAQRAAEPDGVRPVRPPPSGSGASSPARGHPRGRGERRRAAPTVARDGGALGSPPVRPSAYRSRPRGPPLQSRSNARTGSRAP